RTTSKTHDGHAGRHAAAIRKPLHQRRDRRDVAEAEADAADDAGAEPHDPELMDIDAEGADQEASAPTARRDDARLARAGALEPAAPDRGRDPGKNKERRVNPPEACNLPAAGGGEQFLPQRNVRARFALRDSDGARQRQPEPREAVGHADTKMDAERCRRHQPAIEAGRCDRALAIKKTCACARKAPGAFNCSHTILPYSRPSERPLLRSRSSARATKRADCSANHLRDAPGSRSAYEMSNPLKEVLCRTPTGDVPSPIEPRAIVRIAQLAC